ncbi:MAG: HEAT repeat domain-containing protein [Deltaproteobacteria bacterium]|nr:HEAT repeat domain-containing protein [Deltaproteobacteria bacterium]
MAPPKTPSRDPLIGVELDHYRIVEMVAEGGMGVIYRAVHAVIGREAAVKVLGAKYSGDRNMVERLKREARAVSRIGHPNIIDVFDFGTTPDGREYFMMEYLKGETLGELLARRRCLPWVLTQAIIGQVLDALQAAHAAGVIHRDIKPENILVVTQSDGNVLTKVLDFGIAMSIGLGAEGERLTRAGSVMGTPEYISPEQIRGKAVDARADIYALGIILFEAVMGRRPFEGDKVLTLLMAHLKEPMPEMKGIAPELGVPDFLPDVIKRALAKDPSDRYPDAKSLAAALRIALQRVPTEGTRPLPEMYWEPAAAADSGPRPGYQSIAPKGTLSTTQEAQSSYHADDNTAYVRHHGKRTSLAWLLPSALLLLALLAIAVQLFGPVRSKQPIAVDADKTEPTTNQTLPTVADLGEHLTDVRRILRRGTRAKLATDRQLAAQGLGQLRDREALGLLAEVLHDDPEGAVRASAALAIGAIGDRDARQRLVEARQRSTKAVAVAIDEALMRIGEAPAKARLVATLNAEERTLRLSAAFALARAAEPRALPTLLQTLGEVDRHSQSELIAAMTAAARLGDKRSLGSLQAGLAKTAPAQVRLACAESLANLGDERGVIALQGLLAGATESPLRLDAARALASVGDYSGIDRAKRAVFEADPTLRSLAASSLAAMADRTVLPPLVHLLRDAEQTVRIAAATALSRLAALMPNQLVQRSQRWLLATLSGGSWTTRQAAVSLAAEMDPQLAVELLGWALKDRDSRVRAAAVARLGKLRERTPRAVQILTVALSDRAPHVRAAAVDALGSNRSAQDALRAAVHDTDSLVGILAAGRLLEMGDTGFLKDVRQATRLRSPALRAAAIRALGRWPSPSATPLLIAALADRNTEVQLAAALALAQRRNRQGIPQLKQAAASIDRPERAIIALSNLGLPAAPYVQTLGRSKDPQLRARAIELATTLLPPGPRQTLLDAAGRDRSPLVRRAAAHALLRLARTEQQSTKLAPMIRRLLRDADPLVRTAAQLAIARLPSAMSQGSAALVKPVEPASLPTNRQAPRKAVSVSKKDQPLFGDPSRMAIYKREMGKARLALQRASYAAAVRHLTAARAAMNLAPVSYELGLVHLHRARASQQQATRKRHLVAARKYFLEYLRRARRGALAGKARGGLRDVGRLLRAP